MELELLNDQLDSLTLRARQLSVRVKHLQGLNNDLNELNHQLKHELQKANERIKHLETARGVPHAGTDHLVADAREIRKEIQRYIEELDKCIDWLSKQP